MRNGEAKFGFLCLRYIKIEETNFTIGYATMRNGERKFFYDRLCSDEEWRKKEKKKRTKIWFPMP